MGVAVLNPVTSGAGFVRFNNSTYTRFTTSINLKNGAPSALHPHDAPFLFFPVASLLPFAGAIQLVELLWSVSTASVTDGTVGIGFHGSPLADDDITLFTNIRNIDSGAATQIVNASAKGPYTNDLGAGGISNVEDFITAEQDIGMGLDLVTGAANWACQLSTYQLRVTYEGGDQRRPMLRGRRCSAGGRRPFRKRIF